MVHHKCTVSSKAKFTRLLLDDSPQPLGPHKCCNNKGNARLLAFFRRLALDVPLCARGLVYPPQLLMEGR
jgi:hypothetical protein